MKIVKSLNPVMAPIFLFTVILGIFSEHLEESTPMRISKRDGIY